MADFVGDGLPVRAEAEEEVWEEPAVPARGWVGRGPARKAPCMGRDRPFWDGGRPLLPRVMATEEEMPAGKQTGPPGRGPRGLPEGGRQDLGGKDDGIKFMIKLAAGEFDADPFPEDFYGDVRGMLAKEFDLDKKDSGIAGRQCFRLRML